MLHFFVNYELNFTCERNSLDIIFKTTERVLGKDTF